MYGVRVPCVCVVADVGGACCHRGREEKCPLERETLSSRSNKKDVLQHLRIYIKRAVLRCLVRKNLEHNREQNVVVKFGGSRTNVSDAQPTEERTISHSSFLQPGNERSARH